MGFETIKPTLPENPEPEENKPEAMPEEPETLLGKIRKKTGSIAKGLAFIGALSLTQEPGDKLDVRGYKLGELEQPGKFAIEMTEEKLSQEDYLKLCKQHPEKAFVTASLYENEPWLTSALIEAAKNEPTYALHYADRYKNNPEYNTIITTAIDSAEAKFSRPQTQYDEYPPDPLYIITHYTSAWVNTPREHEILEKMRNDAPRYIVENFRALSQSPEGQKIGKQIFESTAKSDPWMVLHNINEFSDEPWAENVIREAARNEPITFFRSTFFRDKLVRESSVLPSKLINKIAIEISRRRPDIAVTMYDATYAMSETDYAETEESGEFLNILKESGDKDLAIIPEIRKMIPTGKIQFEEAQKMGMLLGYISSKRMTMDEAIDAVRNPATYHKLLIEIMEDPNSQIQDVAERYLAEGELKKVENINELHERPDEERFASIEKETPKDLYFTLIFGEEEVFTSTFNGIFDRLLERMAKEHMSGTQLLKQVGSLKFRTFIRTCTEFNRLDDFLKTVDEDQQKILLRKFIQGLDKVKNPLREAVSVAEAVGATNKPEMLTIFNYEIKKQIENFKGKDENNIKILYELIAATLANKSDSDEWLKMIEQRYKLPSLSEVKTEELFNADQMNVQEYFFYNDEDGIASFQNFLAQYKNKEGWRIEDKKTFVEISSHKDGRGVRIYANKPEAENGGPEQVAEELKKQDIKTIVVIHRGHSYHAQKTIRRIPPIAKIVSLGSCGGYRNLSQVLDRAPQAHIISTKGRGTKFVNDPLLKMMNEEILAGHDIVWSDFWGKAEKKIGSNEDFKSYVPPNKNFGATFIKAYKQAMEVKER